jgi:hypothetical protein
MQDTTEFRTNRDLFSNHYLDKHLPETNAWEAVGSTELQEAYDDLVTLWEREHDTAPDRNESQLKEKFIRPMFRRLDIPFEVKESVEQEQRRPDYGFFQSDETARLRSPATFATSLALERARGSWSFRLSTGLFSKKLELPSVKEFQQCVERRSSDDNLPTLASYR